MAGHSKWDNIKHRKQREDARRGKIFTKVARQITVAAREGGGDPESNFRLRLAIEKARAANMPNESIERAIKRGTGDQDGASYEEIVYEGYGPGGMAVLLEITTDNRNRTASDVRHLFSKHGGNLGESGCVAWMFEQSGIIEIPAGVTDEDDVMTTALEAGADDVEQEDGLYIVATTPDAFQAVRDAFDRADIRVTDASVRMRPTTFIELAGSDARKALRLLDALEEHDDVQQVYANISIADEDALVEADQ